MTDRELIRSPATRVPVLAISGFLGAGKTTLVNRILRNADGRRIVVFVNDFGAINIDYDLIKAVESDRISLTNGCVCCTLNNDLVKSIADFVRQEQRPDAIVIEASGISNPRMLDASLGTLETAGLIRLDAKLYVLDATNFDDLEFDDAELIIDHAAVNDIVLLNKVDGASGGSVEKLHGLLGDAAPFAKVMETVHCAVAVDVILGFERESYSGRVTIAGKGTDKIDDHAGRYRSWSFETDRLLDRKQFDRFAENLPEYCLRAKGILRFADRPDTSQIFNLVGYRATLEPNTRSGSNMLSRFVVIGLSEKIEPVEIERAFTTVLSSEPEKTGSAVLL